MTQPRYRRLLTDRNGIFFVELHSHVKVTNPRHKHHMQTGTVVRFNYEKGRVWVALPGGNIINVSPKSLEILP